jgi:hypothetical protein
MVGLAVTAVGMVTKNQTLMKIGGGLSLGSGAGSLAAGAANAGASAASSSVAAAGQSASSAVAPGAMAAGNVAESTMATVGSGAPMGYGGGALAEQAASGAAGAAGSEGVSLGANAATDALASTNAAANPAGTTIAEGLNASSPASQALASSGGGGFGGAAEGASASGGPASAGASGAGSAATDTLQQGLDAASNAPGSQVAAPAAPSASAPAAPATPGVGYPSTDTAALANSGVGGSNSAGFTMPNGAAGSAGASNAYGFQMQEPASFWQGMTKWFSDLDSHGKLAVGQTAAGLVQGIGKGAGDWMSANEKTKFEKQKYNTEQANANSIPTWNVSVNPNYQKQGIINSAKKA